MDYIKKLFKLYMTFFRIGLFTFGGGYAMLPMIEREVVEKNGWATRDDIMDYFALSQCTPGVIAVNTATFIGYKNLGVLGGIFATVGVITPSIIIILLVASVLRNFYDNPIVKSAFGGIGVAVCAILVQAILKIGKAGIVDWFTAIVAVLAFAAVLLGAPTVLVVVSGGILGAVYLTIKEKVKGEEKR